MNKKTKNKMQKSYDAIRMRKATQLLLLCEIVCVCVCDRTKSNEADGVG